MNCNPISGFFKGKIPTYPLSATDGIFKHRKKGKALGCKYIQCNPNNLIQFLVVDIDHENAAFEWSDKGFPNPNIITLNKNNGRGHYVFFLETPVTKGVNARPKPLSYAAAVHFNINLILGGDQAYTNLITKNPFHEDFLSTFVTDRLFSLEDLARPAVSRFGELKSRKKLEAKSEGIGRNHDLFETLRHWGYRAVHEFRETGSYVSWGNEVAAQAAGINEQFNPPLPDSEVRHTVKSVTNWIWQNYHGSGGKRRGIMNLENAGLELDLADRQSMGAQFSHKVRKDASREKIIDAIGRLIQAGNRVSIRAVAAEAGISKTTVMKHKDLIK